MPVSCLHDLPHHYDHCHQNGKEDQRLVPTLLPACLHHRVQLVQFGRYTCETLSDPGCDLFVHAFAPDPNWSTTRLRAQRPSPVAKETILESAVTKPIQCWSRGLACGDSLLYG